MNQRSIEGRLVRLEWATRVLTLALAGLIVAGVLGAAGPGAKKEGDVVTASTVRIVDSDGRILAELGVGPEGPGLYVRDSDGRNRISLAHGAEHTGLYVLDEAGDPRLGAVHFAHGGSGFALHGEGVKGAAVLYYEGGGSLTFYDRDGGVTGRVPPADATPGALTEEKE